MVSMNLIGHQRHEARPSRNRRHGNASVASAHRNARLEPSHLSHEVRMRQNHSWHQLGGVGEERRKIREGGEHGGMNGGQGKGEGRK